MNRKYRHIGLALMMSGLLVVGWSLPQVARASTGPLFVSPGGSGVACTQLVPCALQTALVQAVDGDTIRVAQGTYHQTVTLNHSVFLEGGWNTAFTDRDWDTYITTLDAQRAGSVIQVHGTVSPTIEGFVITGGDGSSPLGWGGGIEVYGSSVDGGGTVVIRHNVITDNIACRQDPCQGEGGGIRIGIATATIEYNTIINNVARLSGDGGGKGGGVMIGGQGKATLTGNTIVSNTAAYTPTGNASGMGGGVYVYSYGGTLTDNEIRGNVAAVGGVGYGGGVHVGGVLNNNRILGNTASVNGDGIGGGVYAEYVTNFEGNTVRGNVASQNGDGTGGGIWSRYLSHACGNTIVDNLATRGGGIYYELYSGHLILRDNLIARNWATGMASVPPDGGGGIASAADWIEITDNRIFSNTASSAGGGVLFLGGTRYVFQGNQVISNTAIFGGGVGVYTATGSIDHNQVMGNLAVFGGGLYVWGAAQPTLDSNVVLNNTALGWIAAGGGVLVAVEPGTVLTMTNHIIARNAAGSGGQGGGVLCWQGDCVLINNTIVDNDRGDSDEGVILGSGGYTTGVYRLFNNIIVGHSIGVWRYAGTAMLDYNDTYDNVVDVSGATWGTHHLTQSPQFEDRAAADYHLQPTSPMIDHATGGVSPDHDYEGDARPMGAGYDIGADEQAFHIYLPLALRNS